jgi:hypothetical protein
MEWWEEIEARNRYIAEYSKRCFEHSRRERADLEEKQRLADELIAEARARGLFRGG